MCSRSATLFSICCHRFFDMYVSITSYSKK
nr:MAG TPA: hypothetical protein [Caudoviricetes sp.]